MRKHFSLQQGSSFLLFEFSMLTTNGQTFVPTSITRATYQRRPSRSLLFAEGKTPRRDSQHCRSASHYHKASLLSKFQLVNNGQAFVTTHVVKHAERISGGCCDRLLALSTQGKYPCYNCQSRKGQQRRDLVPFYQCIRYAHYFRPNPSIVYTY